LALCSVEVRLECRATAETAAETLTRLPAPQPKGGVDEGRYLSLLAMRAAWAGRSRARAVGFAKEALTVLPVTPGCVRPILRSVLVLAQAELTDDAHERSEALVSLSERWGHQPCLAAARSLRGAVAHRCGRLADAAEDAGAALDLFIGCGAPRREGVAVEALARLVDVLVDLGEYGKAAGLVESSGLSGEVPQTWGGTSLLRARGRLRLAAGHPGEGLRDVQAAGARLAAWKVANPAVTAWRLDAAAGALTLGERAEARRQAAEAVEEARRWGAPGALGAALRTLGMVLGGPQGLAALREAAAVLERSGARFELARSLAEYGTALRRAERAVPARRALRTALEMAEECGCAELAQRSRIELTACGGRVPKSSCGAGVAALTSAELRTAMLVAEGRTNREVAQVLQVRQRTVEIHLTHAYRKLGIEGRDSLDAVLRGRPSQ
jgi:DNA-binding CsgD family transcriptional regulator